MRGKYLEDRMQRTGFPSLLWYSFGLYTPFDDSYVSTNGNLGGVGREDPEYVAVRSVHNTV